MGDGGVHASQRHLLALIRIAREAGVERIVVHALTDGRDTRPDAGLGAVREIEATGVRIGTVCGRYWGMDRDRRWDRTRRSYDAIVHGRRRPPRRAPPRRCRPPTTPASATSSSSRP